MYSPSIACIISFRAILLTSYSPWAIVCYILLSANQSTWFVMVLIKRIAIFSKSNIYSVLPNIRKIAPIWPTTALSSSFNFSCRSRTIALIFSNAIGTSALKGNAPILILFLQRNCNAVSRVSPFLVSWNDNEFLFLLFKLEQNFPLGLY